MNSPLQSNSSKSKNDTSCDSAFQKSIANLYHSRRKLATLMGEKQKWLNCQRKASLLVQPCKTDELEVMSRFAPLLSTVSTAQLPNEQHQAQLALIEQIIQESIIIEWPKILHEKCPDGDNSLVGMELDFAPLIHRARNVVKCRTSHPTMRVRVCAIAEPNSDKSNPHVIEAFFRATLVKLSDDPGERQTAGRLILTQREGTSATKYHDQHGVVINMNGKLLISQASSECTTNILSEQYGENVKRTDFKYEHGTLCAVFPELGVTLNSMIDRRQLSTRYAIQMDVALNIENKLVVKHIVLSHEFLIAITNDQTESLLNFIYWPRLLDREQYREQQPGDHEDVTLNSNNKQKVPWGILKNALKYFVKAQLSSARALDIDELLHVQCMLFYPRVRKVNERECEQLEKYFFGDIKNINKGNNAIKLKHRLLTEMVVDDVLVTKSELMANKCISLVDDTTELQYNLWQWLYRITEIIIDVGHKFCPAIFNIDKKSAKTKKATVSMAEYQSMLSLYNNRILTLTSTQNVARVFKAIDENDKKCGNLTKAIYLRFCDENAGYISFAFTNFNKESNGKPLMGSLSSEQIKDFKQGIAEILMDESFLKRYDRIVQLQVFNNKNHDDNLFIATPLKTVIFQDYNTMRLQNNCIEIRDSETIRVNPLTGEKLAYTQNDVNTITSNNNQNSELSNFVQSYVELLLHASSLYSGAFNGTSTGNSINDIESNRNTILEYKKLKSNDASNDVQIAIDNGKIRNAPYSHIKEDITRMKRDPINVSKRIHDERWINEDDELLEALDLTQKRTKPNKS
ncbi:V-type ATP synthase alpha chain [Dirofilaria immitis]